MKDGVVETGATTPVEEAPLATTRPLTSLSRR